MLSGCRDGRQEVVAGLSDDVMKRAARGEVETGEYCLGDALVLGGFNGVDALLEQRFESYDVVWVVGALVALRVTGRRFLPFICSFHKVHVAAGQRWPMKVDPEGKWRSPGGFAGVT